jgi:hypothetical protein
LQRFVDFEFLGKTVEQLKVNHYTPYNRRAFPAIFAKKEASSLIGAKNAV